MNSLIWRGVSSTTISGLLISELPPISKPRMRVKETIIDGRDGSTIEELGYEPYDKPVVIGLHGNFDINKVIKYFTGEGEVVFSNEPDKVYTAKIVEYIDYNRLARYRQATIIFRTQPYKHKLNEVYKAAPTSTAEGTSIVVSDSAEENLKAFSIYGKSTQNGTPTPTAPVDIVSLGADGSIGATINGINLFDLKSGTVNVTTTPVTFIENGFVLDATNMDKRICMFKCNLKKGKTYVVSLDATRLSGNGNVSVYLPKLTQYVVLGKPFEPTEDTDTIGIYTDAAYVPSVFNVTNIQVSMTNVKRDYEPFKSHFLQIPINDVFMAIPVTDKSHATYTDASGQMWCADEIDLERGVYIQRVIPINAGEQYWTINTTWSNANADCNIAYFKHPNMKYGNFLCTHFSKYFLNTGSGWTVGKMGMQEAGVMYAAISKSAASTNDGVKQYMASLGVTIYCMAITPIEIPLTEEQIALCKALKSNKPATTIQNDENAFMKVEYFKPYEVFNEGLENSKPLMVLKGEGMVIVSVNGVATFEYTFPEGENEVVIDSQVEDAYLGTVLKNRNMRGEFPVLLPGTNIIEWTGAVSSIEILPRSRWL